jgi:hypothetical protein
VKNYSVSLKVNGQEIELSGFPRDFVARTAAGAATSLRGVNEVNSLEMSLKFGKVKLSVNGERVGLIQFPNLILASTFIGMLKALNGVEGEVRAAELKLAAEQSSA